MYHATLNDWLKDTSAALPATGLVTQAAWFRPRTLPTGGQVNVYLGSANADPTVTPYTAFDGLKGDATPNLSLVTSAPASFSQADVAANIWRYLSLVRSTSTSFMQMYLDGVFLHTLTGDNPYPAVCEILAGGGAGHGDIDVIFNRVWTGVALAGSNITNEMVSPTVVRTSNLYRNCPLLTDLLDISGNGHHWTQVGAGVFDGEMPPYFSLPNLTAATATDITSFVPGIYTQSLPPFPRTASIWFKFTPVTSGYVSFFAKGDTVAAVPAFNMSLQNASFVEQVSGTNIPGFAYVTAGLVYYVKLQNTGNSSTTTQTLTIESRAPSNVAAPQGAIIINDDLGTTYTRSPMVVMDQSTGDVIRMIPDMPAGESGDAIIATGVSIWSDEHGSGDVVALNRNFVEIARTSLYASTGVQPMNIRAQGAFVYLALRDKRIIKTDGTLAALQTRTHTYSKTGGAGDRYAIAVSPDLSIAYIQYNGVAQPIHRWDLTNDLPLSDLVAGVATFTTCFDLLTLPDGSVLAGWFKSGSNSFVRRYDASGVTVQDYTFNTDELNHLAYSHDPAYFLAWFYPPGDKNRLVRVRVSDGALTPDWSRPMAGGGAIFAATPSDTPTDFFAAESSCPVIPQMVAMDDPEEVAPEEPKESNGSSATLESCCAPSGGMETVDEPNPIGPLPPWEASCMGKGQPDSVADLPAVEVW